LLNKLFFSNLIFWPTCDSQLYSRTRLYYRRWKTLDNFTVPIDAIFLGLEVSIFLRNRYRDRVTDIDSQKTYWRLETFDSLHTLIFKTSILSRPTLDRDALTYQSAKTDINLLITNFETVNSFSTVNTQHRLSFNLDLSWLSRRPCLGRNVPARPGW
jgi:hypothetical protein